MTARRLAIATLVLAVIAFAFIAKASDNMNNANMSAPFSYDTLFLRSTTTVTGSTITSRDTNGNYAPVSRFTCALLSSGTTPTTTVTVSLDGSVDGTNFNSLYTAASITAGQIPYLFHVVNKTVTRYRGHLSSIATGDPTEAFTFNCLVLQ